MPELWTIIPAITILGGLMAIVKDYTSQYYLLFILSVICLVGLAYIGKGIYDKRRRIE